MLQIHNVSNGTLTLQDMIPCGKLSSMLLSILFKSSSLLPKSIFADLASSFALSCTWEFPLLFYKYSDKGNTDNIPCEPSHSLTESHSSHGVQLHKFNFSSDLSNTEVGSVGI